MKAWDDLGLLAAAVLAAFGCFVAAGRAARVRLRRLAWAWCAIGAGMGAWGLGQAAWTWYELVAHWNVPFPSVADAGFLLFSPLTAVGLLLWPARLTGYRVRVTALLDGAAIGTGLLLLSSTTVLGAIWDAGAESWPALMIAMAYPIGDVLLVSLVVLLLARAEVAERGALLLIMMWLLAFALADSAFLYGTATGSYASGSVTDTGWVIGLVALGLAGTIGTRHGHPHDRAALMPSWPGLCLPYASTSLAAMVFFCRLLTGRAPDPLQTWCGLAIFLVGLARQFLMLVENRQLLDVVRADQDQLRRQALHDPLTGLGNRALFAQRVRHALVMPAEDAPHTVLFVDLDDFKAINDRFGHAVGDRLLVQVGSRLRACVREGDTVARIGGDEFALLLHGGREYGEAIARAVVSTLQDTFQLAGNRLQISASIGIIVQAARHADADIDDLLVLADHAMYQAKAQGKNCYVVASGTIPEQRRSDQQSSVLLRGWDSPAT
jgi:diguanylate cyclase (GGDEF)-like protein